MHALLRYRRGRTEYNLDPAAIDTLLLDPDNLIWLDLEAPSESDLALLEHEFHLHPLALEDIRKRNQRPKLERYEHYLHLVLYALKLDPANLQLQRTEVDLVIGSNYVVSVHEGPVAAISALRQRCEQRPELFEPAPLAFLIYHLADGIIDEYFPLLDQLEQRLDEIEELALRPNGREVLANIRQLRETLLHVRNTIDPTRDVFNVLARRDNTFIDRSTALYFADVYDHLLRLSTRVDGLRELAMLALETHLSIQSHALNLTVERLTAITLVLMVITLVTGFCGMNVQFPGRDDPLGLLYAVGLMALIGLLALYYSHRRGWL